MKIFLIILVFSLTSCRDVDYKVSSSGKFSASCEVKNMLVTNRGVTKPRDVWVMHIKEGEKFVYMDKDSTMTGLLSVSYDWDDKDQLWLRNSDNGRFWKWYINNNGWVKTRGSLGRAPLKILPSSTKEIRYKLDERVKREYDSFTIQSIDSKPYDELRLSAPKALDIPKGNFWIKPLLEVELEFRRYARIHHEIGDYVITFYKKGKKYHTVEIFLKHKYVKIKSWYYRLGDERFNKLKEKLDEAFKSD